MTTQWTSWELIFTIFVANMGAGDYAQRERAQHALVRLAPLAAHRLQVAERSADREIATRARQIMNRYYADAATDWVSRVALENHTEMPWIADLSSQYLNGVIPYYLDQARRQLREQGPPDWNEYRLATRLLIEDLYRRRVGEQDILRLLNELAELERQWAFKNGKRSFRTARFAKDH